MILHAPLALLGVLFVAAATLLTPAGGLSSDPLDIVERAAGGLTGPLAHADLPADTLFARAD